MKPTQSVSSHDTSHLSPEAQARWERWVEWHPSPQWYPIAEYDGWLLVGLKEWDRRYYPTPLGGSGGADTLESTPELPEHVRNYFKAIIQLLEP